MQSLTDLDTLLSGRNPTNMQACVHVMYAWRGIIIIIIIIICSWPFECVVNKPNSGL